MGEFRIFTPHPLQEDLEVTLSGDQARHVGKVLRLRAGDELVLFDNRGGEYRATVLSTRKSAVIVRAMEFIDRDVESPLHVHLLQCVSRGERMDFVVQKATELGVRRITPLLSEFSVVKLDADRAQKRRAHWEKVAAAACEQSGRTRLPEIDLPVSLADWLGAHHDQTQAAAPRVLLLPGASRSLPELATGLREIVLLIGPEGGLSATERDNAGTAGFAAASLGPRILRTETAAVAALSVLQALAGDFA